MKMKKYFFSLLLCSAGVLSVQAQNPYMVKTNNAATQTATGDTKSSTDPTDDFVTANFPRVALENWTTDMKFMVLPERKDLTMEAFYEEDTNKKIGVGQLKYKILEYQGYEITEPRNFIHFKFYNEEDNKTYYYEVKNQSYAEFCGKPKAGIPTLAYLGDVDKAKELLEGRTLYTAAGVYLVDDATAQSGSHEINVPKNTAVTVVAVGAGTRSYPVKIVVKDPEGREFFQNVCISKTNNGMRDDEFIMDEAKYFFPNSFKLVDPNAKVTEQYMAPYEGKTLHLTKKMTMDGGSSLKRYTVVKLTGLEAVPSSNYFTATFKDENGKDYTKKVTFNRESVIGNIAGEDEMYIGDVVAFGDVRTKMSKGISKERMDKIAEGQVEIGMTKEECRLAKGNPTNIHHGDNDVELWSYTDEMNNHDAMLLTFTKGNLTKITR